MSILPVLGAPFTPLSMSKNALRNSTTPSIPKARTECPRSSRSSSNEGGAGKCLLSIAMSSDSAVTKHNSFVSRSGLLRVVPVDRPLNSASTTESLPMALSRLVNTSKSSPKSVKSLVLLLVVRNVLVDRWFKINRSEALTGVPTATNLSVPPSLPLEGLVTRHTALASAVDVIYTACRLETFVDVLSFFNSEDKYSTGAIAKPSPDTSKDSLHARKKAWP
mmetsp:Transcript_448/g.850  ORF Transcript_448/g.850 Transcript_448/m.850 type:complete len:221 (-) Transcript_448:530-1192(-)